MKYFLLTLLILVVTSFQSFAFSDNTTSTILTRKVVSASYLNLLTNDLGGLRRSEGIALSFENLAYRTRIMIGAAHCKVEKKRSKVEPIEIKIDGTAAIAGIDFDINVGVGDLTYSSKEVLNIYDMFLFGDYSLYRKLWILNNKDKDRYETSHQFNIRAGTGIKFDIQSKTKTYYIYQEDKLFDTIENPVSGSKASGLMYYVTNSIDYRFSLLNISLYSGFNFQHPKEKSFIMFTVGGAF